MVSQVLPALSLQVSVQVLVAAALVPVKAGPAVAHRQGVTSDARKGGGVGTGRAGGEGAR